MKRDRTRKRRKREERESRVQRNKLKLIHDAMCHAGLGDPYARVGNRGRSFFVSLLFPCPRFVLSEQLADAPESADLLALLDDILHSPSPYSDHSVTPHEWYRVLFGLSLHLRELEKGSKRDERLDPNEEPLRSMLRLGQPLREFVSVRTPNFLLEFFLCVHDALAAMSRIDRKILVFDVEYADLSSEKTELRIHIDVRQVHQTTATIDGVPRPIFRWSLMATPPLKDELSWPKEELGVLFGPERFPVYFQRHAIEQLQKRIPGVPLMAVAYSLCFPEFASCSDGRFLIAFGIGSTKLGYFAGDVLSDKVLIKTFLFLTMRGCPEGDLLARKLGMSRKDLEFTELDSLRCFTESGVRTDPRLQGLRDLLEKCGCGHLLKLDVDDEHFAQPGKGGNAEMLAKYLSHGPFSKGIRVP